MCLQYGASVAGRKPFEVYFGTPNAKAGRLETTFHIPEKLRINSYIMYMTYTVYRMLYNV